MNKFLYKITSRTKSVNFYAIVLLVIFWCTLICCFFYLSSSEKIKLIIQSNQITQINNFDSFYKSVNSSNSKPQPNTLYDNGKTAILGGVEKLKSLPSWQVVASGTLKASFGATLTLNVKMIAGKRDDEYYHTIYLWSDFELLTDSCQEAILHKNDIEHKYTINVWEENGNVTSNINDVPFSPTTSKNYSQSQGILPGDLVYDFNKRSIKKTSEFFVKHNDDNSIAGYQTNFTLDNNLSTHKYITFIKSKIGAAKNFEFKSIQGYMTFDESGRITKINSSDTFSFVLPVSVADTKISAVSNLEFYFTY